MRSSGAHALADLNAGGHAGPRCSKRRASTRRRQRLPDAISSAGIDTAAIGPASLVSLGKTVCARLENHVTFDSSLTYIFTNAAANITKGQTFAILGASVGGYCPDQMPAADKWSRTQAPVTYR
jgi:hypothetical protein